MTAPLGTTFLPSRTAEFRSVGGATAAATTSSQALPHRASPALAHPTPDHLALVQAFIRAGQFARGMELLDAVWQHELHDEHCWFLRLWLLAGQGRVLEALELARVATGHLPGSAAIACLRAALEHAAGDPQAAVESALRAAAIAPGRAELEVILERVLEAHSVAEENAPDRLSQAVSADPSLNPVAVALGALTLLHPAGSDRPFRPSLPACEPPVPGDRPRSEDIRRIGLIAIATVVAALWAVREPLLATVALAGVVAWLTRAPGSRRA